MEITVKGEKIELNGKIGISYLGKNKITFGAKAETIELADDFVRFTEKTPHDVITHEINQLESVTIYDKAVYVYGMNAINGNKTRFILDRK